VGGAGTGLNSGAIAGVDWVSGNHESGQALTTKNVVTDARSANAHLLFSNL
jgi:hypothetical protein